LTTPAASSWQGDTDLGLSSVTRHVNALHVLKKWITPMSVKPLDRQPDKADTLPVQLHCHCLGAHHITGILVRLLT